MWLVGLCIFGMLLVGVISLAAAVWWEADDSWLSRQFMRVCWCAIAASVLFLGVVIII